MISIIVEVFLNKVSGRRRREFHAGKQPELSESKYHSILGKPNFFFFNFAILVERKEYIKE